MSTGEHADRLRWILGNGLASAVSRVLSRWQLSLVAIAILVQIAVLVPRFNQRRPSIDHDALLFEYSGIAATRGALPYVDLWDPKPPLVHEVAAGLAFVSGGDPLVLHLLSVGLMSVAVVSSVLLVAHLTYISTDSEAAGLATGLVLLAFPVLYLAPARGLRPKLFVILFGFLSVFLLQRGRFASSGTTAAIAAGFWQFGLLFPLVVLMGARRRGRSALLRVGGAIVVVTLVALLPFVLRSGFWTLLSQVVVAPLVTSDSVTFSGKVVRTVRLLAFATPLFLVGTYGFSLARSSHSTRWITFGGIWFTVQVVFLDFDGAPDLFLWGTFLALGYGLVVARCDAKRQHLLVGATAIVAIVMMYWTTRWGGFTPAEYGTLTQGSLEWYFWTGAEPESCHLRQSEMERQFVARVNRQLSERSCAITLRSLLQLL